MKFSSKFTKMAKNIQKMFTDHAKIWFNKRDRNPYTITMFNNINTMLIVKKLS